ncbi:MAG: LPS export ABC transporter permease LptF [Gammaproteobacteria bacterium]
MILERYLIKETLRSWVAVFVVLLVIVISVRFVRFLGDAAAGKVAGELVYQMLGFKLITSSSMMIPLCLYLAVYLTYSRMQRDKELTAIAGAGLGDAFFVGASLKTGLAFAMLTLALSTLVCPWAERQFSQLREQAQQDSDITGIAAGQFREFAGGKGVIYVRDISKNRDKVSNVFLQVTDGNSLAVLTSNRARLETDPKTGNRFVVFERGNRYSGRPGQLDFTVIEYQKYAVLYQPGQTVRSSLGMDAIPTRELIQAKDISSGAELQWRAAMPIAAMVLATLAAVLARLVPGDHSYTGLLIITLIYFLYSNLLGIAKNLVKNGDLAPYLGLWVVHATVVVVLLALLYYPALKRWWLGRRRTVTALST